MKRSRIFATVLIATLALSGCSASMAQSESASDSEGSVGQPAPVTDGGAEGGDSGSADREVIVTVDMVVTVDKPADAAAKAVRLAESSGGRVDGRSESAPTNGDEGSARVTLRVPTSTLTSSIDKLKKLGKLESLDQLTDDVTTEVQDIDARISALQSSLERLHRLLRGAESIRDLITLESEITTRQGELESLQAQQRYLSDKVSLSTIDLSLISEADAPYDEPETFLSGLETGWDSFTGFIGSTVVVIGVLLPWLAFFTIIAGIVWLVLRRRRAAASAPVLDSTD